MTSPALETWRSDRLDRLDRMIAAHPGEVGSAIDPVVAQEWTDALVLRLAAEFQGFCRDLHDNVVTAMLDAMPASAEKMRNTLMNGLIIGRGLDRRGADPKTIHADFNRLGLDLWVSLAAGQSEIASTWREALLQLHKARNGVAHDDRQAIATVQAAGWPVRMGTIQRWRKLLDETAKAMDHRLSADIAELIGKSPWEGVNDGI